MDWKTHPRILQKNFGTKNFLFWSINNPRQNDSLEQSCFFSLDPFLRENNLSKTFCNHRFYPLIVWQRPFGLFKVFIIDSINFGITCVDFVFVQCKVNKTTKVHHTSYWRRRISLLAVVLSPLFKPVKAAWLELNFHSSLTPNKYLRGRLSLKTQNLVMYGQLCHSLDHHQGPEWVM